VNQLKQTTSILDAEPYQSFIADLITKGETNASIVRALAQSYGIGTSDKSIRRFRARHELAVPGQTGAYTKVEGEKAEAQTPPETVKQVLDDPDTMLRERGLDPEDWVITHMTPNMYEGPNSADAVAAGGPAKITYYQTKFSAKKKLVPELQVFAPRTDGWVAPEKVPVNKDQPYLVVVVGDQQAPYQDPNLHRLFLQWLRENRPDQGISLGDSVDFPDISRHQLDPENTAVVNECLQAGYDLFRGYVDASPTTPWTKLIGNHDERIRNILLDKPSLRPLYGVKRPDTPDAEGEELLNLRHAMRLDELGIDVIDPHGKYDLAQVVLTPKLAVRHGWLARKGSGASALASLDHLGHSVIVGHTHRQSVVHHTKHEIDGKLRTLTGVEAGCMCRVEQTIGEDGRIWPNYTPNPDWQQGFCTVEVWPDGFFNIDTAKYVNGTLMWRDRRYTLRG
jgi:hypothetical protein